MILSPDIEKFDVVTIGAGPGGATLATYLTRAGLSVLLLEKQSFPHKSPSEQIPQRTSSC
ncbi:MAG: FAD-dependent monooxygenase [Pleurocapsa sp. MO_226.B13]|nr:FAD-dependent monooxygenase [Pleurocapsa sp. MO_226.B13]